MAYGNYGASVYKNGIRQHNREDNKPYQEDSLQAGYYQVFGDQPENEIGTMHATLGNGSFRLCGYKCHVFIYWEGKRINEEPYRIKAHTEIWDHRSWYEWDFYNGEDFIEGELNGYIFKAQKETSPDGVSLELIEPDGTIWQSIVSFGYED